MSAVHPQGPEVHCSDTPLVETAAAPFAGVVYTGVSGDSGVNAEVSRFPVALFHLRSKLSLNQVKNQGLPVK